MNVLSLFDGMSCGQIALMELGIPINKYYASEIDKFAIEQTKLNFPDTIQLGDVTKWKEWDIDWGSIDLVIGGSPCQGFSMAGKQLAFDDPRSVLFFEFVDIVNHVKKHNPNMKFLLENVQMAKRHLKVINDYMGVHPVEINSSLVSAQNRVRLYWSNIRVKEAGLFGEKHTDIPQPKDRGIYLKDILEENVDDRFYLSDKRVKTIYQRGTLNCFSSTDNKIGCLIASYSKIPSDGNYIVTHSTQPRQGKEQGGKGVYDLIYQLPRGYNKGGAFKDKTPTLSSNSWENNNVLLRQNIVRRLTPTECARLQTIPDWYKWECSNTQQYKMLGNGWTVEVIKHIFSFLKRREVKRLILKGVRYRIKQEKETLLVCQMIDEQGRDVGNDGTLVSDILSTLLWKNSGTRIISKKRINIS